METGVTPRRHGPLMIVALVATLAVAACSGTATTPPATQGATPTPAATTAGASAPATSPTPIAFAAPEKTSIKIGLSTSGEASEFAPYYANQLGLYQKYGFTNVDITSLQGDGKVVQAVVAGALDFGVNGVGPTISSQNTDTPLKALALVGVTLTDMMVCGKDIKTAADMKGKKVAISTFGGTSHGSVLILLNQLGLTDKDVTITQVGSQDVRLAAVVAGSVACAPIDLAQKADIQAKGLSILADNKSSGKQWGRAGAETSAAFIAANPNTVTNFLAAVLEAQNDIFLHPDDAAVKFQAYSQQTAAQSTAVITDFITWGDRSMAWTDEAFTYPKTVLEAIDPTVASVDVTKCYDKSFLQKLSTMGFYQQIGDPSLP